MWGGKPPARGGSQEPTPGGSGPTSGAAGVPTGREPTLGAMIWIAGALAVLPDIDLIYLPIHRTATHSVAAALLVTIVAAAVTGWVTGRMSWRIAIVCGAAYGSHILMDWMGADASVPYGLQMFWPFSHRWFISPWPIFPGTERRQMFGERAMLINLRALAVEVLLLGPWVAALWIRRTRRSRGPTSVQGGPRRPSA